MGTVIEKNNEESLNEEVINEEPVVDEVTVEVVTDNSETEKSGSSTGLEENVAGLLCYLATFVTGIIFLILEKKSDFVRFHAMQSTIFFVGIWVVGYVINYVPFLGWLLSSMCSLLGFIMWIVLMIKAYQKEYFKLPIVAQIAEDLIKKNQSSA